MDPVRNIEELAFSMAFQPIVDAKAREIISYEALVRGPQNQPAGQVFACVPPDQMASFDLLLCTCALRLAIQLALPCALNLNLRPSNIHPAIAAILTALDAESRRRLPLKRLMLELTEGEIIDDHVQFAEQINEYRRLGLKIAIDDFGAGYSGLNLLAEFQPDEVKLDMKLIRGIDGRGPKQAIVRAITQVCYDLGIDVIAEGVETREEYDWLRSQGIFLFQGYFFARPGFECLPAVTYPEPRL